MTDWYRLRWFIWISAMIHTLAFVGHWALSMLWGWNLFTKADPESVLPPSLRVDLVGLPDITRAESPTAPPPPPAAPAEEAPSAPAKAPTLDPKVMPELKSNSARDAINRMRAAELARQKAAKIPPTTTAPKTPNSPENSAGETFLAKGNQVAQGSSLTGEITTDAAGWSSSVVSLVQSFWELPADLKTSDLQVTLRVFVASDGSILSKLIAQSSGNELYDQYALQTLERVGKLPSPPADLIDTLRRRGKVFRFVPGSIGSGRN